jgi:hypothetical protein
MNVHDYMQRLRELLAATDIIIKERDEARIERDHARRERDEARLEIWKNARTDSPRTMLWEKEFAVARGWDFFDKENHNA